MRFKYHGSSSIYTIFLVVQSNIANNWFGHKLKGVRWSADTCRVSMSAVSVSASWENLFLNRIRVSYACTDTLTAGRQQQSAISLGTASYFSSYCRKSKTDCTNRFMHVVICFNYSSNLSSEPASLCHISTYPSFPLSDYGWLGNAPWGQWWNLERDPNV